MWIDRKARRKRVGDLSDPLRKPAFVKSVDESTVGSGLGTRGVSSGKAEFGVFRSIL